MSINDATSSDWDKVRDNDALLKTWQKAYFNDLQPWEDESLEDIIARKDEEDMVGKPKHYNSGNIECIDAIEESMSSHAFKGYLKGNCMKYLWRYDYKGKQVEDLQKAGWYLNKLTEMVTKENS